MRYIVQPGPDNDWDILDTTNNTVAPFYEESSARSAAEELNNGDYPKTRWSWLPKDY